MQDIRRAIPSVERLLGSAEFAPLLAALPRTRVIATLQREQNDVRNAPVIDAGAIATAGFWAERVRTALANDDMPSLRSVINATGVVLHTNLGRAPLAEAALRAVQSAADGYTNLEYDLAAGARGSRYDHFAQLLCELTGAEAALVVNNNAAALVLALGTLAHGRSVIVSRGELVEIGDGFRIPEICARSGAVLREVGATNRTHLRDYADALDANGGLLLKVHPSNYRIAGFAQDVSIDELAGLARSTQTPLVHDLGSGLLLAAQTLGLPDEPRPQDALAAGADIVTMSGDKLLGGPQAGIVLGRRDLVARMRRDPLCRALRVDKLTLAALEATLRLYRDPQRALAEIPALRMIAMPAAEVEVRVRAMRDNLVACGVVAEVVASACTVGGGAFPGVEIPSFALRVHGPAVALEQRLRTGAPPVVARVHDDALHIELRTVQPGQDALLERALVTAVAA